MSDSEHPTVAAGGPLCGDALRETADWLDLFDEMALNYFDVLEYLGTATHEDLAGVRAAVRCKDQQADLRRWADEIDVDAHTEWVDRYIIALEAELLERGLGEALDSAVRRANHEEPS